MLTKIKLLHFQSVLYLALFYSAAQFRLVALHAIVVLAMTVLSLIAVTLSEVLASILQEGQSTFPYCLQTTAIASYLLLLIALYRKDGKDD